MKNKKKYSAGEAVTANVGIETIDDCDILVAELSGKITDFCVPSQATIVHGIFEKYCREYKLYFSNVTKVSDTKFIADVK